MVNGYMPYVLKGHWKQLSRGKVNHIMRMETIYKGVYSCIVCCRKQCVCLKVKIYKLCGVTHLHNLDFWSRFIWLPLSCQEESQLSDETKSEEDIPNTLATNGKPLSKSKSEKPVETGKSVASKGKVPTRVSRWCRLLSRPKVSNPNMMTTTVVMMIRFLRMMMKMIMR